MDVFGDIKQYVEQNPQAKETQLFSFLALMNTYIPESYLLKSECQTVLGPPDPIHGGPPFEERMKPFTAVIDSSTDSAHVFIRSSFAQKALAVFTDPQIKRSGIVNDLMSQLCGDEAQEDTVQFVKALLTKRKMGENGKKENFSWLIEDILDEDRLNGSYAISVLETASHKMRQLFIFPQTLARLYYKALKDYVKAETWAKEAIKRDPSNSYVADTLGHVYKNWLLSTKKSTEIFGMALNAFDAFKDVEKKAEAEAEDMDDEVSFNNRGHFGFMQVAKISFEKLTKDDLLLLEKQVESFEQQVEDKFSFFEWYLTYSSPSKGSLDPPYFWKDVALCYQYYTEKKASDSTSFPGLLDFLNHGQFTSRGRRARLEEHAKTVSDLDGICHSLIVFQDNDDVKAAQRYILSNIILSNKTQNSSEMAPVRELQNILHNFLGTANVRVNPELNLLVLMLFWPEDHKRVAEVKDEEEVRRPELPEHVTFMEQAFESAYYAKYLRGRYLLPLFFLGKGSGLNKWIHKSTLDAIVEEKVGAERDGDDEEKQQRILDFWSNGKVWQIPEIQEILLPVEIEPLESQGEKKWVVHVGGLKIPATAEFESDDSALSFYLGLTIKGPVVFKVDSLDVLGQ